MEPHHLDRRSDPISSAAESASTGSRQIGDLLDVVTTGPTNLRVTPSDNDFDVRAMTGSRCERCVAGDDCRIECLRQSNVHGVVRRHVVAQLPRSSQKVEMGVTVEVEIDEVFDRFGRTNR